VKNNMQLRNQKGFSTVWLLGFAVIILLCGLVIFDITRVYIEREKLVSAADAAANAGATAIDEGALPDVKLDPTKAITRCEEMLKTYSDPGGAAHSILDAPGSSKSKCELDTANSVVATASGSVDFSFVMAVLGTDSREMNVSSRSRPSCSDVENC
jgi:uncharacterized membrane protein